MSVQPGSAEPVGREGPELRSLIAKVDQFWEYDGTDWDGTRSSTGRLALSHPADDQIILKTDDRIELATKLGRRLKDKGSLTALGSFRTQLAPGLRHREWAS